MSTTQSTIQVRNDFTVKRICVFILMQWDGRIGMWTYTNVSESDVEMMDSSDGVSDDDGSDTDDSDDAVRRKPRRSKRLAKKRKTNPFSMLHNLRQIIMD